MKRTIEQKLQTFWAKVDRSGDGCWEWTGYVRPNGYGHHGRKLLGESYAHRIAWTDYNGDIPEGLDLDHLCRNRSCVNPIHLEPVTRRENLLRSPLVVGAVKAAIKECPQGHPYDSENTYIVPGRNHRLCRECRRNRNRERERAKRIAAKGGGQ